MGVVAGHASVGHNRRVHATGKLVPLLVRPDESAAGGDAVGAERVALTADGPGVRLAVDVTRRQRGYMGAGGTVAFLTLDTVEFPIANEPVQAGTVLRFGIVAGRVTFPTVVGLAFDIPHDEAFASIDRIMTRHLKPEHKSWNLNE